jgi:alkylated DNA repair dioxygenase AlkB
MNREEYFDGRCVISRCLVPDNVLPQVSDIMEACPGIPYKVTVHGKTFDSPRFTQAYGHDYNYSGQDHPAHPIPAWLEPTMEWARGVHGVPFNSALINWYMNGHHYIAPHSDKEGPLAPESPIATISLGQIRKFRLRLKGNKEIEPLDINLPSTSCLVMHHPTQTHCTHEIVKVSGEKGAALGPRVSITLRVFL